MTGLCNHIKALRKDKGMTQADLAQAVGVTRKTINTIENRVFVPSTILALQIAAELGVSLHDVFELEED